MDKASNRYTILLSIFLGLISAIILFLIVEAYFFYTHAKTLFELKDDYRNYTTAVRKVLHDYNKTKERLDLLENYLENEKKNGTDDGILKKLRTYIHEVMAISYGADLQDDFVLVNRDLSYLYVGYVQFITYECGNSFLNTIPGNIWLEYTEFLTRDTIKKCLSESSQPLSYHIRSIGKRRKAHGIPLSSDIIFSWPIERPKCWLSSLFGPRLKKNGVGGFHYGLDMAAIRGTPVKAVADGIITEARYARGYGKTIVITHNQTYKTRYAHLDKITVSVGKKVNRGICIGLVGSTGTVRTRGGDGSHLHFEVCAFGRRVNPVYFLAN